MTQNISTTIRATKNQINNAFKFISALILILSPFTSSAHFGARGPFGGTVSCTATNDSILYIGTENGGVYESTTNGITAWLARPVGLTSGKITALTHSGKYLFAGTADHGIFIFNGYVGADRYWNKINSGLGNLSIKSLIALDSITIIAGTNGNGLYKTTNKGTTWTSINVPTLNNSIITSIVKSGNRLFLITQTQGAFISDDNGATWTDFNDANTTTSGATKAISYNVLSDELLVLNNNGIFTTANASTLSSATYTNITSNLPSNTNIKSVANNGANWYLATDNGVYTSPSNTINWTLINTGLTKLNITAIAAIQNRLIAGVHTEGIFKAIAGVHTWVATNGSFNNAVTNGLATEGISLVIAITPKGVHVNKNFAATFTMANNGLIDSTNINDIITADFCLLAATKNGGVFFTPDTGKNWFAINTGLTNLNIKKLFYANFKKYAIDIAGNIFQSDLHSSTWKAIQAGLPNGVNPTSITYYGGKLILGTLGAGVFIKDEKTGSWTASNSGLNNLNVTSVTASRNKIYAGTNGSGVFISDANTINWTATSATSIAHTTMIGLDGTKIQAMGAYAGYVYASYKGRLLASSDNGATWIAGGNQFNLPSFTDVNKINFVTTRVYVSTENNGIYSNSLSELAALANFINVSKDVVNGSTNKDTVAISVNSNIGWKIIHKPTWANTTLDTSFRDNVFNIMLAENTGSARVDSIVLRAGTAKKTILLNQAASLSIAIINSNLFNVYPNPTNGNITINTNSNGMQINEIAICDIYGKVLEQTTIENSGTLHTINVKYATGVYILNIYTNKGVATKKIIIQ